MRATERHSFRNSWQICKLKIRRWFARFFIWQFIWRNRQTAIFFRNLFRRTTETSPCLLVGRGVAWQSLDRARTSCSTEQEMPLKRSKSKSRTLDSRKSRSVAARNLRSSIFRLKYPLADCRSLAADQCNFETQSLSGRFFGLFNFWATFLFHFRAPGCSSNCSSRPASFFTELLLFYPGSHALRLETVNIFESFPLPALSRETGTAWKFKTSTALRTIAGNRPTWADSEQSCSDWITLIGFSGKLFQSGNSELGFYLCDAEFQRPENRWSSVRRLAWDCSLIGTILT